MTRTKTVNSDRSAQIFLDGNLRKGLSAIASRQTWASDTQPCIPERIAENVSAPKQIASAQKCHSVSFLSL